MADLLAPRLLWPLFGLFLVTWIAGKLFRRYALSRFTILNDLPALGTPRKDSSKLGDTVILCGGSFAGLLSARVCTDHFSRVIVIDPEASSLVAGSLAAECTQSPPPHTRVMQYNSVHTAQAIYVAVVDRLFGPAYLTAAKAAKAIVGPGSYNVHIGNTYIRTPLELLPAAARTCVGLTRAAHETILRGLVARSAANLGIEFVNGTVVGFDFDPADPKRIASVRYRPAEDQKAIITLESDLVVDCSGASRAGLSLLQRASPLMNLPKSITESYHPHMRYSSCTYPNAAAALEAMRKLAGPEHHIDSPFPAFFVPLTGVETKWIGMVRVEYDQCRFLAGGANFQGKIESAAELRDHAKSIKGLRPLPDWFIAVLDNLVAQEEEGVMGSHEHATISPMTFVRYHEHTDVLPRNFVALGDAWMRLNPVMGQGLAKVALEVTTLDSTLRATSCSSSGLDIASTFFSCLAARTERTWSQTKVADYALDSCEPVQGESREATRSGLKFAMMSAFTKGIGKRMMRGDRDIAARAMGVSAWVRPATDLFVPSVVGKILLDKALGR